MRTFLQKMCSYPQLLYYYLGTVSGLQNGYFTNLLNNMQPPNCLLLWVEVQGDPRSNTAREHLAAKYGTLILVCHNEKSSDSHDRPWIAALHLYP